MNAGFTSGWTCSPTIYTTGCRCERIRDSREVAEELSKPGETAFF